MRHRRTPMKNTAYIFLALCCAASLLLAGGQPPRQVAAAGASSSGVNGLCPPGAREQACQGQGIFDVLPAAPSATGGPDIYGYTWNNSAAFDWKEATKKGTRIWPAVMGSDVFNAVSGAIALPFPFKFYEKTYNQVYVSLEGIIGFTSSLTDTVTHIENLPIPSEILPDGIIAPYWEDLLVSSALTSTVYYTSTASYFAVEWSAVATQISYTVPLTFQVVLYADHSIGFYYKNMQTSFDSATIGIEDGDGFDALQYSYNAASPANNTAIKFTRPPANEFRAKAFPVTQSGFNIGGESVFKIYVRNSGDFTDTYYFQVSSGWPNWKLYKADGLTPVTDTDFDSAFDTGPLAAGSTFTTTLKVKSPGAAVVGTSLNISLTVFSVGSAGGKSAAVAMRTALPAPFAITQREGQLISTELISRYGHYTAGEYTSFTGGTLALGSAPNQRFIGLWHDSTGIHYSMFNGTGVLNFIPYRDLALNSSFLHLTPVTAMTPDGHIGVALRSIQSVSGMSRHNVYFQVLDADGDLLFAQPITVTNNLTYTFGFESNIIRFDTVRVTATDDNRFVLTWIERHVNMPSYTTTDIARAVYSSSGALVSAAALLFTWAEDPINYSYPNGIFFRDWNNQARILLPYFYSDQSLPLDKLSYVVLDTSGALQGSPSGDWATGTGNLPDGVQLSDNRLAVTWVDTSTATDHVQILILNNDQPLTVARDINLPLPDGRPAVDASVTRDDAGNAIVTWGDLKWQRRLYYALVNYASGLIGQPIVFRSIESAVGLRTSDLTQGNAPLTPWWRLVLPVLHR